MSLLVGIKSKDRSPWRDQAGIRYFPELDHDYTSFSPPLLGLKTDMEVFPVLFTLLKN